eukprot:969753-Alexandrium_andersonii.AAC.1
MDPNFLQQVTASGLLLGQSSTASDSKEAWKLLARVRALVWGVWVEGRVEAGSHALRACLRHQRREHRPPGQAARGAGTLPPGVGGMGPWLGSPALGRTSIHARRGAAGQ